MTTQCLLGPKGRIQLGQMNTIDEDYSPFLSVSCLCSRLHICFIPYFISALLSRSQKMAENGNQKMTWQKMTTRLSLDYSSFHLKFLIGSVWVRCHSWINHQW